jgi:hypothetical protein
LWYVRSSEGLVFGLKPELDNGFVPWRGPSCFRNREFSGLDQAALIQGYAEQLEKYSERKPRHARSCSNGPTSPITSTEGRALALTIATN